MPRFDGTGPQGAGPMTGRGEGYCVVQLAGPDRPVRGYAGLEGAPVWQGPPSRWPAQRLMATVWPRHVFGRGRHWGARCGSGYWVPRW